MNSSISKLLDLIKQAISHRTTPANSYQEGYKQACIDMQNKITELLPVEPQRTGEGIHRYNTEKLWGDKIFNVRAVTMQDLKDDDCFWSNRQGGGFLNASCNGLAGKEYDNLVVLVLVKQEQP